MEKINELFHFVNFHSDIIMKSLPVKFTYSSFYIISTEVKKKELRAKSPNSPNKYVFKLQMSLIQTDTTSCGGTRHWRTFLTCSHWTEESRGPQLKRWDSATCVISPVLTQHTHLC